MNDWQLLDEYAARGSDEAFRELVDRYAGMVYHAAMRQVRDPQAAQEVAQTVFIALARKAHRIPKQTVLYGWLFRATRYASWHFVREESRRRRYEDEAATMDSMFDHDEATNVWDQISPYLNDALDRLSRLDRDVLMVRYFGNKSHKEVAQALGLSEDTAKKRVSRALEKLRTILVRRGVAVSSIALAAAFSTCGAQAAPAGLTLSISTAALAKASGTTSLLKTAGAVLKLMAWAKAKTVMTVGAGVLLVAAGTATVAVNTTAPRPEDLVAKLRHPSGIRIAWDRHLELAASLDLKRVPLEQGLDDLSVHSGAYWTIDYAVYGAEPALRRLLDSLHEGTDLQGAGWTNLSARPLKPNIMVTPDGPNPFGGGGFGGGSGGRVGGGQRGVSDLVTMMVVLRGKAVARWQQEVQQNLERQRRGDQDVGVFDTQERAIIRQAMNEGVAEGVLAPERLLAEAGLISRLDVAAPAPATAETAERLAKAAHAHWTTIYTLRKSPVEGAGIKLVHSGMENMYWRTNASFGEFVQSSLTNRFNLSPEAREAHDRAVQAFKSKK